jgi:DNA-binding response OmpR family regulator
MIKINKFKLCLISDNEKIIPYFNFLKNSSYGLEICDSKEAFWGTKTVQNLNWQEPYIFIVDNNINKFSIKEIISWIKYNRHFEPVIVFDKATNTEYIKEILKFGANNFLDLPEEINFEKPLWEKKVLNALEQVKEFVFHQHKLENILGKNKKDLNWKYYLFNDIKKRKEEILKTEKIFMQKAGLTIDRISTETNNKIYSWVSLDDLENLRRNIFQLLNEDLDTQPQPHILTVEDEKDFREFIVETLNMQKYKVFEAENGSSALDILKKEQIDVILLDIMLPDIKGTDLIKIIKELQPEAEIIALTAYNEIEYINKTLGNGAFDYINKPFEEEDLIKTIQEAFNKKYYTQTFDELIAKVKGTKLSKANRLTLFEKYFDKCKNDGKNYIDFNDIFFFFYELKSLSPEVGKSFPKKIYLAQDKGNLILNLNKILEEITETTNKLILLSQADRSKILSLY